MGRPDLSEQRTAEILDAFARCVARQGLGATSVQDIADEAGMKRPIIRHYVGNRADLVTALAEHVGARYCATLDELVAALPAKHRVDEVLQLLLPATPSESAGEIMVLESLIAAAAEDDTVREPMLAFVDHTLGVIRGLLADEHPGASPAQLRAVAYGVVSIWFNHSSLTPLRPPGGHRRAALGAARGLVGTLSA